jgi:hypothetical protein
MIPERGVEEDTPNADIFIYQQNNNNKITTK